MATKEKQATADEEAKKEGKEAADPVEAVTKSEAREEWDWRVQNDNKPLWTRSPKEVSASLLSFYLMIYPSGAGSKSAGLGLVTGALRQQQPLVELCTALLSSQEACC